MVENLRLSFKGIWSHKLRSFLTMLGIIIGIAAIIAIVSTIQGANKQIEKNLIGSNDNLVQVQLIQGDWEYDFYNGNPTDIPVINQDELDKIREIDTVDAASTYRKRQEYSTIFRQNTSLSSGIILGVNSDYLNTCRYKIYSGRGFSDLDIDKGNKVAILTLDSAKTLFVNEEPIGKTIEIKGEPFIVVGVIEKIEKFEPIIETMEDYYMYTQDKAGQVLIPTTTWPILYQYDEPQQLVIRATDTKTMSSAGKKAEDILNYPISPDSEIEYRAENLLEQAKQIQQLSKSTNMMLIWIAAISLLVGGIGVMNIMLVSVSERTNEIGLKKAIGAKKHTIRGQFLTESAVLTSIGGILGVAVGILLSHLISNLTDMPVAISIPAIAISVIFSMVIGIVFGLLPAFKASNLNPIDALRYE